MGDDDLAAAAARTYVYGYPLLYCLEELAKIPAGEAVVGRASVNSFAPARELLGPDAAFVTPNNDTLYLMAACDVSAGPVELRVPDTADRYYVLQFVDAWSNNFAYVGRRATGTAAGRFLLVGAGRAPATVDEGVQVIEAPSDVFVIVGRIQVDGDHDLAAVHALQDQFTLVPADTGSTPTWIPAPAPGVPDELVWWERLRVALAAFPPPSADTEYLEAAAALGLTAPTSPFVDPDPDIAAALVEGRRQGEQLVEQLSTSTLTVEGGWSAALHAFDFNLDRLELGTVDTPEWRIADRTTAYVTRAVAARLGLWGNHGYEARYDILWRDEDDHVLDGSGTYELTLSPPPAVDAFWSLTMYDSPAYYLVDNPIDRYAIGDRTPGLRYGDDGSLTIYLQTTAPGGDRDANWLPTPPGVFRPVLRSYQPRAEVLAADYRLPSVRRTG